MSDPRYVIARDLYAQGSYYVIDAENQVLIDWCGSLEEAYSVIAKLVVPRVLYK